MNTRKKQILSLLIVGAMAVIGTSATEAYAVVIPVQTKAELSHPALPMPITLTGTANIQVIGSNVNPGNFYMTGPMGAKAVIDWSPGTVSATGSFTVRGSGRAKFKDPATGLPVDISFKFITTGRTDSVSRAMGRFHDYATSTAGSHLRGRYHH